MEEEWIRTAAAGVYLIPNAVMDLRMQKISMKPALGGMAAAAAWLAVRVIAGHAEWTEIPGAIVPGGLILALSYATGGKIGIGDGIVLLGTGFLLGGQETLAVLLAGLFFSFLWSVFLLVFKKARKNTRIPWIPFLSAGYAAEVLLKLFAS